MPGEVSIFFRLGEGVGPVVFLQHGLLCSSVDWVLGARDKALGWYWDNRDELEKSICVITPSAWQVSS